MNSIRYRPDIDGLRAVAVISVLLYHLSFDAFGGGYIGVDVFFVISGFLITRLIRDEVASTNSFSFSNFYSRRARRLFPSLFLTLIFSFALASLLFSADHMERFGGAVIHTVTSTSNFYFWRESGYFDTEAIFKPLLHTWSLGVEEQFYLIWPPLLVFLILKTPKLVTTASLLLIGLFSLWLNFIFADGEISLLTMISPSVAEWFIDGPSTIFYLLPFRIFEFTIGALVVWLIAFQPRNKMLLEPVVLVGLTMIAFSIFAYDENTLFPSVNALIPCVGTALIIFAGPTRFFSKILTNRLAVFIGLISYSLYLVHWPIIVFYRYYKFEELQIAEKTIILAITIAVAALMYRFIEQPFRRGASSPSAWSRGGVGFACAVLGLIIIVPASNSWANGGWEQRVAADIQPSDYFKVVETYGVSKRQKEESERLLLGGYVWSVGSSQNSRKKVLIIGDSHARALGGLGNYLGDKYNVEFEIYPFSACPPIFGTYKNFGRNIHETPSPFQQECFEQIVRWEEYIEENRFDYVLLVSRWATHFEDPEYGQELQPVHLLIDKDNPTFSIAGSRNAFQNKLAYTVNKIRESGAEPIVFGQSVNYGKVLEGCNNTPKYLIKDEQINARCAGLSKKLILERMGWTNGVIKNLGAELNAGTVIPTDYFCDDDRDHCRVFLESIRLSDDGSHLNKYGAIYLAKQWELERTFPFKPVDKATESPESASASVEVRINTPSYNDGSSGWSDMKLAATKVSGIGSSWRTISLPFRYDTMVVVCSPQYQTLDLPAVVRVQNISANSFDVRVQNPKGNILTGYTAYCLVVEEGVYTVGEDGINMEASSFSSTVTDSKETWFGHARHYLNRYENPVVIGQVMTANDPEWSSFWSSKGPSTDKTNEAGMPPTSTSLNMGKHVGKDPNSIRQNEILGYIVVEAGSGTIDGVPYVAAVGEKTIGGFKDLPPYIYSLNSLMAATDAVVSSSGMQGTDGGFPAFIGANPINPTFLELAIDEYQSKDRKHTEERVAYIAFGF